MKISNREKIMLCILGSIIVGFGYYKFGYSVQMVKIEAKDKQRNEIEQKYTTTMNTINSMEDRKSDVKILKAKITDQSVPFYPVISEEHIILELDTLLNESGLKGGIKFEPIVSNNVESSKKENVSLAESSLQGIVEKYDDLTGNSKENKSVNSKDSTETKIEAKTETKAQSSNTNQDKSTNKESSDINNSNSSEQNSNSKDKKNTVHYLKCAVDFQGNYNALNTFLNKISINEKKIVVNSIKIDQDTLDTIKGTINLEIYAIPKINDELESYLKWKMNNTYGKSVPFSTGAANGNVQAEKDTNDFVASVKSINSDLPTIMIGKANDELRTTYAYADNNGKEEVEMILTQDGDKYYYKYKTSKGSFPANYDGLGAEFAPASKNIVLSVLSESRVNANDNSGIKLKIVNKTDRLVNVNISGEDKINPRVVVDGDGSNISVNQK